MTPELPLTAEATAALTQAEMLSLTGQPLTRAVWEKLSVHAPEADLERHLRQALEAGLNVPALLVQPGHSDLMLPPEWQRLARVTQSLHLREADLFAGQRARLFRIYLGRRTGAFSRSARALLNEFSAVLIGTARPARTEVLQELLTWIDPDSPDSYQDLCDQTTRITLGHETDLAPLSVRRDVAQLLLSRAGRRTPNAEKLWTAAAKTLEIEDDSDRPSEDGSSVIDRLLDLWRRGTLPRPEGRS